MVKSLSCLLEAKTIIYLILALVAPVLRGDHKVKTVYILPAHCFLFCRVTVANIHNIFFPLPDYFTGDFSNRSEVKSLTIACMSFKDSCKDAL